MGTSNSNQGQKGGTPLVPSWLDDDGTNGDIEPEDRPIPPLGDNERFRIPRGDFTKYVNSSGRNGTYLHKAVNGYVNNSLGGAKNATSRLGAAKASSGRLISIFNGISNSGLNSTLEEHGLGTLIGRSVNEIFIGIVDFICPDGGSTDEGIARSSFIETLSILDELGITDIDEMNENQFLTLTETYISNVIQARLINDIGNKSINLPDDIGTVDAIQNQIGAFIQGAVCDAIVQLDMSIRNITPEETRNIVEKIYETSYTILGSIYDGSEG
ncbi:MAG TPA: Qat anti-phage system associated protein QatB [Clostridium sp.]